MKISSIDAVIMLTMSNWHTEMRSNRYHFASRFAKSVRTVFVQADLKEKTYRLESTQIPNLEILHIYELYGPTQTQILTVALHAMGIRKSLLWIYNPNFIDFVSHSNSTLKIFHATEDFFSDFYDKINNFQERTRRVLSFCNLVIPVSQGVETSLVTNGKFKGETLILTNGVDLDDWILKNSDPIRKAEKSNIAVFQGNLNIRINLSLYVEVARRLPHWIFKICGKFQSTPGFNWNDLLDLPNVDYLGALTTEELVKVVKTAKVGIIPFHVDKWLTDYLFPLKALEYVAAGLKVVSIPFESLEPFTVIQFARNADEFVEAIDSCAANYESPSEEELYSLLSVHSYDNKFRQLQLTIENLMRARKGSRFLSILKYRVSLMAVLGRHFCLRFGRSVIRRISIFLGKPPDLAEDWLKRQFGKVC